MSRLARPQSLSPLVQAQNRSYHRSAILALKVKGSDVKVGNVLMLDADETLAVVKKSTIVKPGKGGAFNNLELTTLSGRNLTLRLR